MYSGSLPSGPRECVGTSDVINAGQYSVYMRLCVREGGREGEGKGERKRERGGRGRDNKLNIMRSKCMFLCF